LTVHVRAKTKPKVKEIVRRALRQDCVDHKSYLRFLALRPYTLTYQDTHQQQGQGQREREGRTWLTAREGWKKDN
jgi:hypothetical protein